MHSYALTKTAVAIATLGCAVLWWTPPACGDETSLSTILDSHQLTDKTAALIQAFFARAKPEVEESANLLLDRLREGLAKKADPDLLLAGLDRRLQALIQARQILTEKSPGTHRGTGFENTVEVLTHALESGLPARLFDELLANQPYPYSQRVRAIIEAGERMHLAEVETSSIDRFMQECRERNLRRMETIRTAQLWIEKKQSGMEDHEIAEQLWPVRHAESLRNGRSGTDRNRSRRHRQSEPRFLR